MKLVSAFGIIALGFLLSIPVILLTSYVVLDLAKLYNIPFVMDLSQYQIIGSIYLLSLLRPNKQKIESGEKSQEDMLKENMVLIFTRIIEVLVGWGIATLFFEIVIK